MNTGLNKSFEEYLSSLLKYQLCTYRRPDSEDVPQYGWDAHKPFTTSPHSSASGNDMVYTATGLTYLMGSYVYPYGRYMYCIHAFALYWLLCISSLIHSLIPMEQDSPQIFYIMQHQTECGVCSMACSQNKELGSYQSNNEAVGARPVVKE